MNKLRKALLPVVVFAKIDIRRLFRDKIAIFFTFLFPLIFLFIFGGIFGQDSDISFNVALIDKADSSFSKDFAKKLKDGDVIKVNKELTTREQADLAMERSQIDAIFVLPKSFGDVQSAQKYPSGNLEIYYSQNNQQAGQTLSSVMQTQFAKINEGIVGEQAEPLQ